MTTRKQIENLREHSGSKTAAALAYLLGYGRGSRRGWVPCCASG